MTITHYRFARIEVRLAGREWRARVLDTGWKKGLLF
jgi:hypothetical protein